MPLIETKGAASAQGFGEFLQQSAPIYIEDVFSTYLYTGNGSTQTITNGIDLSTKGGLVWTKARVANSNGNHLLVDTARGAGYRLQSNTTDAQYYNATAFVTSFNSNGYNIGDGYQCNESPTTYASWTFRKQPKFFDIVTYTGNNAAQTISHNLGSTPGCVIIKCTNTAGTSWWVRHRSVTGNAGLLNSTSAFAFNINDVPTVSDTALSFASGGASTNVSGETYVAYLFAHDAGGFGLSGTDNVISCGSFTHTYNGSQTAINLGWESQFVLVKQANGTSNWVIYDNMRGMPVGSNRAQLYPEGSFAEGTVVPPAGIFATATGFTVDTQGVNTGTYIYIAIRRGPMKVPTSGTSVFNALTNTGTGVAVRSYTGVGFPPDTVIPIMRTSPGTHMWGDRLRGSPKLDSTSTAAEDPGYVQSYDQNGWTTASDAFGNNNTFTFVDYVFRRAPGFFDVVAYTGTGVARTVPHNLAAVPEMMIVKSRSDISNWRVYHVGLGATKFITLDTDAVANTNSTLWNDTQPTNSVFTVGTAGSVNQNASTFIAYLFASAPGVSKVGSYTGTGALQTINCGFTGGARFVLIKRTDSTGDWYVYDSARGISSGNDPYLFLNSTAAEVTGTNYVDTTSVGFQVTAAAPAGLNANGGTYIFLAIA